MFCVQETVMHLIRHKKIESFGVGVLSLSVDMANVDDNKRIVDEAANRFGGVDILVNNSRTQTGYIS